MEGTIIDDLDEEEDNDINNQISGRNCILFIVDARNDMFCKRNDGTSYFKEAILGVKNAMLDIARKQRGDLIGILLYGTQLNEGKYAPDNVSILQDLVVPSVSVIKNLSEMIEDDFKQLSSKYGNVERADITRTINYGQIVIHLCKMKLHLKNIVLMTYDDLPCGNSEKAAFLARKQASELYDHGIEFDVVPFGEFDSSKLFKELILTSKGELLKDWEKKDPVLKMEGVQTQIDRITQKFTRRLSFLRIGGDTSRIVMQISLYKLYTEPRKFLAPLKSPDKDKESNNLEKNKNQIENKLEVLQHQPSTSGLQLNETKSSSDVAMANTNNQEEDKSLYPFLGRKRLDISKTELNRRISAQAVGKRRGFRLIGFVQTAEVPLYFSIGEPHFVVPHGRNKNNRIAFSHLLQRCSERGVSMVGCFCLTKSSIAKLAILHPFDSSTSGKGHPKGFLLTKMPYEDDLHDIDEEETAIHHKPSDEQLNAAKQMVSKLTLPYTVDMFSDCEYLKRLAMIEALAMEYDEVPETEDNTDIDTDDIAEMLGELNELFIAKHNSGDDFNSFKKGSKRPMSSHRSDNAKHRKQYDVMQMILDGQANKLTVAELKEVLKEEGIKSLSAMTKPRLVDIATRRFCKNSQ